MRRLTAIDWALVAATLVGLALLLSRMGKPLLAVLLASSGFVALGGRSVCRERSALASMLAGGLVLCWVGDVVGILGHFVPSVVAFLTGHLVFAAGFFAAGTARRPALGSSALLLVVNGLIGSWLLPSVASDMRPLILGYMLVISIMVVAALSTRHANRWPLAVAACLFYVSDIAVARWKFVSPGWTNAFFCYPLYYTACMLLAVGSRRSVTPPEEDRP